MTPESLTDSEIIELIERYSQPSYRKLSKTHDAYLKELEHEARIRKLKPNAK